MADRKFSLLFPGNGGKGFLSFFGAADTLVVDRKKKRRNFRATWFFSLLLRYYDFFLLCASNKSFLWEKGELGWKSKWFSRKLHGKVKKSEREKFKFGASNPSALLQFPFASKTPLRLSRIMEWCGGKPDKPEQKKPSIKIRAEERHFFVQLFFSFNPPPPQLSFPSHVAKPLSSPVTPPKAAAAASQGAASSRPRSEAAALTRGGGGGRRALKRPRPPPPPPPVCMLKKREKENTGGGRERAAVSIGARSQKHAHSLCRSFPPLTINSTVFLLCSGVLVATVLHVGK